MQAHHSSFRRHAAADHRRAARPADKTRSRGTRAAPAQLHP
ncbi:MAG: hypothetical protein U5L06_12325 [Rhodovibrio sp.]|nr:hypothetical protein [Rhodovibrio sp.]